MPVEKFKYYYTGIEGLNNITIHGTNDINVLRDLGIHGVYSTLDIFTVGSKQVILKFLHAPLTYTSDGEPFVFILHQYEFSISMQPLYEKRYYDIDVAQHHFEMYKRKLAGGTNHAQPSKAPIGDLTKYLNCIAPVNIPIEIAPEWKPGSDEKQLQILKILDAAQDENGIFLYPLYAKIEHPIEQFWVRMLKRDIYYYGIVENRINEREALGFTLLDVITFGVPHIKTLL